MTKAQAFSPLAAVLISLSLAACTTTDYGGGAGRLLVAPDKFQNYSCEQLALRANGTAARRKQLEGLMAKSGSAVVNALAYQSEYTETAGDLAEMRRTAAERNCKPIPALAR